MRSSPSDHPRCRCRGAYRRQAPRVWTHTWVARQSGELLKTEERGSEPQTPRKGNEAQALVAVESMGKPCPKDGLELIPAGMNQLDSMMFKVLEENQLLKRWLILESALGRRLQGGSGTELVLHSPMSSAPEEVNGPGAQSGESREFSEGLPRARAMSGAGVTGLGSSSGRLGWDSVPGMWELQDGRGHARSGQEPAGQALANLNPLLRPPPVPQQFWIGSDPGKEGELPVVPGLHLGDSRGSGGFNQEGLVYSAKMGMASGLTEKIRKELEAKGFAVVPN